VFFSSRSGRLTKIFRWGVKERLFCVSPRLLFFHRVGGQVAILYPSGMGLLKPPEPPVSGCHGTLFPFPVAAFSLYWYSPPPLLPLRPPPVAGVQLDLPPLLLSCIFWPNFTGFLTRYLLEHPSSHFGPA